MSSNVQLPPKKEVALALLEGSSVFIHLDPRNDEVRVPPWFKRQPRLVLQIGLNMPVPIPDLNLDEDSVSCTLSFNRSPHFCRIPWAAVFALVGEDGRGMLWPDDIPPEVAAEMQTAQQKQARSHLRAVRDDEPPPARPAKRPRKKRAPRAKQPRVQMAPPPATEEPTPDAPPAEPVRSASASGKKPKRELPPYLRVVK